MPREVAIATAYTGMSLGQLGAVSPEELDGLIKDLTIKGLNQLFAKIREETGIAIEPGSFFLGLAWNQAASIGMPHEAIIELIQQHDMAAMVERLRAEVE